MGSRKTTEVHALDEFALAASGGSSPDRCGRADVGEEAKAPLRRPSRPCSGPFGAAIPISDRQPRREDGVRSCGMRRAFAAAADRQ